MTWREDAAFATPLRLGVRRQALDFAHWIGDNHRMPKVFEKDGYTFFFYSNDHRPIHVHVLYGGGEAVFNVEGEVELRESQGLKVRELSRAEQLAVEHRSLIVEKWYEHLS